MATVPPSVVLSSDRLFIGNQCQAALTPTEVATGSMGAWPPWHLVTLQLPFRSAISELRNSWNSNEEARTSVYCLNLDLPMQPMRNNPGSWKQSSFETQWAAADAIEHSNCISLSSVPVPLWFIEMLSE